MNEQRVLMRKVELVPGGFRLDGAGVGPDRNTEVANLIAEIVEKDRVREPRPRRRRAHLLPILLVVLSALGLWNFMRITAVPQLPESEAEASARAALYLISASLDEYRRTHGALPSSLEAAGLDTEGVIYEIEASRYVLRTEYGRVRITYHEGQNKAPFAAALGAGAGR